MLTLNKVCRWYRDETGATLHDIEAYANGASFKLLSAFERGHSANMRHISAYHSHAKATGNLSKFIHLMGNHFYG